MCIIHGQDGEIVYTDWKLEKDDSGRLHSEFSPLLEQVYTHTALTLLSSVSFPKIMRENGPGRGECQDK